ncbi:hypothetical protein [Halolamina salifodinae]|uniref:Uncharacterized protein n=1 Tax=Halolamina salifodinae TaxID=1202767 RepID=A0A8T4GUC6_9EURY|nr:hypothetical protein [Halolamina salifodinae]MBP1985742.1 hypothetical protein [Halolamina salifodinae]
MSGRCDAVGGDGGDAEDDTDDADDADDESSGAFQFGAVVE